jgi:hypothetical protein
MPETGKEPSLVLVTGLQGMGKSTVAKAIAQRLSTPRVVERRSVLARVLAIGNSPWSGARGRASLKLWAPDENFKSVNDQFCSCFMGE